MSIGLQMLIAFGILGIAYTYTVAIKLSDNKEKTQVSVEELMDDMSSFNLACIFVFGPFVILIRRIIRKIRR